MTNKYGDKYRVYDWVKFSYSEIGEYIDENHTDKPLRNDEIVDLLNEQEKTIQKQNQEIKRLTKELKRCWEIKNINTNTEVDPKKVKSEFMNLMIELQE